jgi:hypothetical protein
VLLIRKGQGMTLQISTTAITAIDHIIQPQDNMQTLRHTLNIRIKDIRMTGKIEAGVVAMDVEGEI